VSPRSDPLTVELGIAFASVDGGHDGKGSHQAGDRVSVREAGVDGRRFGEAREVHHAAPFENIGRLHHVFIDADEHEIVGLHNTVLPCRILKLISEALLCDGLCGGVSGKQPQPSCEKQAGEQRPNGRGVGAATVPTRVGSGLQYGQVLWRA
jgi:hypothetical protein